MNEAISNGFYIEAVCIAESIIADLLERRIAWLTIQSDREFSNLGPLITKLRGKPEPDSTLLSLLTVIDAWRIQRNQIHELVKLSDIAPIKDWDAEYLSFKQVAEDGKKIANELSKNVRRVNK